MHLPRQDAIWFLISNWELPGVSTVERARDRAENHPAEFNTSHALEPVRKVRFEAKCRSHISKALKVANRENVAKDDLTPVNKGIGHFPRKALSGRCKIRPTTPISPKNNGD